MIHIQAEFHYNYDSRTAFEAGFSIYSENEKLSQDCYTADKELTAFGLTTLLNVAAAGLAAAIRNDNKSKDELVKELNEMLEFYLGLTPVESIHRQTLRSPDRPVPPGGIAG